MTQLATFTSRTAAADGADADLAALVTDVVSRADASSARSQQTRIGPSELGHPCPRRIAYRVMGEPEASAGGDPWPAVVGTATHAWLAEAFEAHNTRIGYRRFLTEQRVQITDGTTPISGTADVLDTDTGTVLDHKLPGTTAMRSYRNHGPSRVYRVQAHLYGRGFVRAGYEVNRVAIAYYPRGGMLSGLHTWSEPFDPQVAADALQRHDRILEAACALAVDQAPEHYAHIPAEPAHSCTWCPWFQPGAAVGRTCPGHMAAA